MKTDYKCAAAIIKKFKAARVPEISTGWRRRSEALLVKGGFSIMASNTVLVPKGEPFALVHHGWGDILLRINTGLEEKLVWLCAPKKDTLVGMGEIGDGGFSLRDVEETKLKSSVNGKAVLDSLRQKSMLPHPFFDPINWLIENPLKLHLKQLGITYLSATPKDIFEESTQLVAMSGIYQKDGDREAETTGAYLFVVHKFLWKMINDWDRIRAIKEPITKYYGEATRVDDFDGNTCPISKVMKVPIVNRVLKTGNWALLVREVGGAWKQLPWS